MYRKSLLEIKRIEIETFLMRTPRILLKSTRTYRMYIHVGEMVETYATASWPARDSQQAPRPPISSADRHSLR